MRSSSTRYPSQRTRPAESFRESKLKLIYLARSGLRERGSHVLDEDDRCSDRRVRSVDNGL